MSLSPEFYENLDKILGQNSRVCGMTPRVTRCLNCRGPLERTAFNGNPVWEHVTLPGERHGPWPRTHCPVKTGHECGNRCQKHAVPDIGELMSPEDVVFLWEMQIGI